MGFNQFEGLVDSFNGSNVDDYLEHCLPTIPQVVRRLNEIRAEHSSTLSRVYILTNAWPSYITTLSSALLADSWENVSSTSDIGRFLNKEQRYVDVVVDMALAVDKAEVFVGNGVSFFFLGFKLASGLISGIQKFSSLSANVVMLRIAKGLPVNSNRFL